MTTALTLRRLLILDGFSCLLLGALLCAMPDTLAPLSGLPEALLRGAGLLLFPCAALMFGAALPSRTLPAMAWLIVLGNVGWIAASLAVLALNRGVTPLGEALVLGQAAVVAVVAWLEYRALRTPKLVLAS